MHARVMHIQQVCNVCTVPMCLVCISGLGVHVCMYNVRFSMLRRPLGVTGDHNYKL